jgi:hypothetical protein
LRREGKQEESDRLIREYIQKYSETADGYRVRTSELLEKDPEKAKPLLSAAIKKFPQEGGFVFDLATILPRRKSARGGGAFREGC